MSAEWIKTQPKNRNYLNPIGFKLNLEIFDGVDFFCQSINLPDVSIPFTNVPTRFREFPIAPGGGLHGVRPHGCHGIQPVSRPPL